MLNWNGENRRRKWQDEFPADDASLDAIADPDMPDAAQIGDDAPPAIGQDERRMQVRAYNCWAQLLGQGRYPLVSAIKPNENDDFGPFSVMLDFAAGIENPLVSHLGAALADECGVSAPGTITQLSDVPPHSLLSRVTDHYIQILAHQTPIGFEAEFVNRERRMVLYRGILLPFSRDGRGIDHVFGVLNWKEMVDENILGGLRHELSRGGGALAAGHGQGQGPRIGESAAQMLGPFPTVGLDALDTIGPEYTLLLARRDGSGRVGVLGELPHDERLVTRAARNLLASSGTKAGVRRW